MHTGRVTMVAPVLAVAGLSLVGVTLVARAQHGSDGSKASATVHGRTNKQDTPDATKRDADVKITDKVDVTKPGAPGTKDSDLATAQKSDVAGATTPDGPDAKKADKKLDDAQIKKLRAELDDLLNQRADIDRKIAEVRGKLGPNSRTQPFEFRNNDGAPRIFEFHGDVNGNLPPEARKQLEEMQKRLRDAFGNSPFGDMQMFDFDFGNGPGANGGPDMKSFRDSIQKWREGLRNRMQRRQNGAPGQAPGDTGKDVKPQKPAQGKIKTFDA